MIKSINYNQSEILSDIIKLYIPSGKFDLDPCYSKGVFYKDGTVPEPILKFDYNPIKGCPFGDSRDLESFGIKNNSLNSIVFDPPFLATKGPSLSKTDDNNKINKRFGVYPTELELWTFYKESIQEFSRVLKKDGILVFKCQDKVSSGKQYIMHNEIINECKTQGFECEDIFILLAKNRLVADWQVKNQKHARKFHSYFLVFKKVK